MSDYDPQRHAPVEHIIGECDFLIDRLATLADYRVSYVVAGALLRSCLPSDVVRGALAALPSAEVAEALENYYSDDDTGCRPRAEVMAPDPRDTEIATLRRDLSATQREADRLRKGIEDEAWRLHHLIDTITGPAAAQRLRALLGEAESPVEHRRGNQEGEGRG